MKCVFAVCKGATASTMAGGGGQELTLKCLNSKINAKMKLEHFHILSEMSSSPGDRLLLQHLCNSDPAHSTTDFSVCQWSLSLSARYVF